MTNATPVELYVSEDRSIYRINRLRENGQFFTFERLTGEGINELIDLSQNNKRSQKNTRLRGTTTRQAATEARTTAENAISGGDYFH